MLVNALNKVGRAIVGNPTIPVLDGIKLVANESCVEITGSDGNLTIITKVKKDDDNENIVIEQEGAVILPAKEFMSIAKVMPDETISITAENDIVKLKSGKSNFKLNGREANEYPTLNINKTNEVKVDSDTISNLFQKTGYCVSKLETRPILTGVNLSFDKGVVSVVSTDAHR